MNFEANKNSRKISPYIPLTLKNFDVRSSKKTELKVRKASRTKRARDQNSFDFATDNRTMNFDLTMICH